jgi:RimJ/RimL family protein N-acetyltransferase
VQLLPEGITYDGRAIYFAARSREVDLAPLVQQLPPDRALRRADRELFARSIDRDLAIRELGSVEAVLQKTLRVFLMRGDEILCEAATGVPTGGTIEIGVTTYEGHRRQGYATIACARLIMLCEEAGYATWWDCAEQNVASAALARKLGYRHGRPYRVLMWPQQRGE